MVGVRWLYWGLCKQTENMLFTRSSLCGCVGLGEGKACSQAVLLPLQGSSSWQTSLPFLGAEHKLQNELRTGDRGWARGHRRWETATQLKPMLSAVQSPSAPRISEKSLHLWNADWYWLSYGKQWNNRALSFDSGSKRSGEKRDKRHVSSSLILLPPRLEGEI